jgi:hypothetical protein
MLNNYAESIKDKVHWTKAINSCIQNRLVNGKGVFGYAIKETPPFEGRRFIW